MFKNNIIRGQATTLISLVLATSGCGNPTSHDNFGGNGGNNELGGFGDTNEEVCLPNNKLICGDDNNVYWENSCGDLESIYQLCDQKIESCLDGICKETCDFTAGCDDDYGSIFCDPFGYENLTQDCRWEIGSGLYEGSSYISNGKLVVDGTSAVGTSKRIDFPEECKNNFEFELSVKSYENQFTNGYRIQASDNLIIFSGSPKVPNTVGLHCPGHELVYTEDMDLSVDRIIKIEKKNNGNLDLYVDGNLKNFITCEVSQMNNPFLVIGSLEKYAQNFEVDQVKVRCLK